MHSTTAPAPRRTLFLTAAGALSVLALLWFLWPVPDTAAPPDAAAVPQPHRRTPRPPSAPGIARAAVTPDPDPAPSGFLVPAPDIEPPEDTGLEAVDEDMPLYTVLRAHILGMDGAPVLGGLLTSPDCSIWSWTDDSGVAEAVIMGMETCTVQGRRPDGLLWGRSEWLEVEMTPDSIVEVELLIPQERTGGLGVMIRAHEEGMVVERVWPGTPAEQMGLSSGDLITEVDGLPTTALTVDEFVEVMTGPEGSDVVFAVAYEGDTGWIEEPLVLTRARIEDR